MTDSPTYTDIEIIRDGDSYTISGIEQDTYEHSGYFHVPDVKLAGASIELNAAGRLQLSGLFRFRYDSETETMHVIGA